MTCLHLYCPTVSLPKNNNSTFYKQSIKFKKKPIHFIYVTYQLYIFSEHLQTINNIFIF